MVQLSLIEGINQLHWSVFSSDGLDTTFANDSIFTFSIDLSNLSIDNISLNPERFILNQNFPNPFNPQTLISYEVNVGDFVKIAVYDLNGKWITNLIEEYKIPGKYNLKWNGLNNLNQAVGGGIYIYTISSNTQTSSKKMILLK